MEPALIVNYDCVVGEGPLWHPAEQRLYWVDIDTCRLFRYSPATGASEQYPIGEEVGGFTLQADGALLLLNARGAVRLWRDGQMTTVRESIPGEEESRFNDAIADPAGRVFAGTLPVGDRLGRLYRLDPDGSVMCVLEGIGCSNGMGFTADYKTLYFTDSIPQEIYAFDYDMATGVIANRRLFASVPKEGGLPDGLTVDAEGAVWSARWGGGCVVRYSPSGHEIGRIMFPAKEVSSVTFGGPDYGDLYVTTAGGQDKAQFGPGAGALFRVRPGVLGVPEFVSRIRAAPVP